MTFTDYLNQSWKKHGDQPEEVAKSLANGLALCASSTDVTALVQLTVHLYAEHLHRFHEAELELREIEKNGFVKGTAAEFTVARAITAFQICEGSVAPESDRLGLTPGDLARSLATAASALALRESSRSEKYYKQALELAASVDLSTSEGVAQALASTGNSIARKLEDLSSRTDTQKDLMLLAANTARKFWEIAGTWLEVERAEYRLAKSHLAAGNLDDARVHANLCLSISEINGSDPLEVFFAYEVLADIEKAAASNDFQSSFALARTWFDKIAPEDQSWARASLNSLM